MDDFKVTPWDVEGTVDYNKLIEKFGTKRIDDSLISKIKEAAGDVHFMIRRGFFFSHRDLDKVLDDYKSGKGFFLYTGRGPSGKMHLGHIAPLLLTKWLQEKFNVNLYIEITDDEKFLHKRNLTMEEVRKYAIDNILDIIALGFDPDKTFIFLDTEYIGHVYKLMIKAARKITFSTVKAVFGFTNETNIGMIFYPTYQIIPTFFEKRRALIPAAIDQDPYWRVQRDIAESLGYYRAAAIHSKFVPPLEGISGKMSSSKEETAIWLDDDEKMVRKKIMKYAFSGGQPTVEEHRKYGGNPDVDVSFQWLSIFLEEDDKKLKKIEEDYRSGKLLSGELKQITVDKINKFLKKHRDAKERAKDVIDKFMWNGKLAEKMWSRVYE